MSTPLFDRLRAHCQRLRLHRLEAELPALLEQAAKRDVPYSDFLDELLTLEIRSKAEKHLAMRVAMARFPFQKTIDAFDFKFQPSIDPKVIRELATGRYLESGDNVLLLGPPRVRGLDVFPDQGLQGGLNLDGSLVGQRRAADTRAERQEQQHPGSSGEGHASR